LLLNNTASANVQKDRETYPTPNRHIAFFLAMLFTSGRIHGEFLRLITESPTGRQSNSLTPLGNSHPPKLLPSAAPNISSIIWQL